MPPITTSVGGLSRRSLLRGSSALALALAAPRHASATAPVNTKARIVVAGGGAAGLTVASRLARRLHGAEIVMVEPRAEHNYQPGYTLVGAGLKPASYVKLATADFVPSGVRWVRESIAEFDPTGNKDVTNTYTTQTYDFLVVATGLVLDYDAIQGMSRDLIGQNGIASVYAGPEQAEASWKALAKFCETGGTGLFGRPETEMKCAGAPLKQTFLADDHLRRKGMRGKAELIYNAHNPALFSVPKVDARVRDLFARQEIKTNFSHVLKSIDPGKRIATYATPGGPVEMKWDFINVIPPMRAPAAIRKSPLPWQSGAWASDGWIEVDRSTLRHVRFANIFGVGDINGVPKGKTAASVKWQAPVAVDHLVATITGKPATETYNGYTSCPLITRIGQAMLVEFDYNDNLTPSFPFIDPLQEHWLAWVIKEKALKANYTAMLQGLA